MHTCDMSSFFKAKSSSTLGNHKFTLESHGGETLHFCHDVNPPVNFMLLTIFGIGEVYLCELGFDVGRSNTCGHHQEVSSNGREILFDSWRNTNSTYVAFHKPTSIPIENNHVNVVHGFK